MTPASHPSPKSHAPRPPRRAFTLVEMLVVIGIVAVLAAILLPAVIGAINRARIAAIAVEIGQLADGVESYRKEKGDYPPNFRDYDTVMRHIGRCYPKIDRTSGGALDLFIVLVWGTGYSQLSPPPAGTVPKLDEGEALLFWLATTRDNLRDPFGMTTAGSGAPFKKFYEFNETRYADDDGDSYPAYRAKYCKDSCYIYIDHRSYLRLAQFAAGNYSDAAGDTYAFTVDGTVESNRVRPYWSAIPTNVTGATTLRTKFKPMNATTFQIICAGQDGDFGFHSSRTPADPDLKVFPNGDNYKDEDNDNITNFSEGARLQDKM